jgi:hypothetical protein
MNRKLFIGWILLMVLFVSCERNFDIKLNAGEPSLVVEGYINNLLPLYNYVVLTRSQSYTDTNFQTAPVTGAVVTITEGSLQADQTYLWDASTRVQLKETKLPQLGDTYLPGVYFDTTLATNPGHALLGKPGKSYLLEIRVDKLYYTSVTSLLPAIPIDSLTIGHYYIDVDDDTTQTKARLTVHYKDPDTVGNTQLYYWNHQDTWNNFGWGGLRSNRFSPGTDDLVNGQNIHLTHSSGFAMDDSVKFYMASVERSVYNFWDSFNKARSNGGPFSTPVTLVSNMEGEHVTGCFSGFSLSNRNIRIK